MCSCSFVFSNQNHANKKTIAVIGATGSMGAAISKNLSRGNVRLLLYGNEQDKINALVHEIKTFHPEADVQGNTCPVDASWEADIIILAVPYKAEKEVAEKIKEVANQKIVISISNPLNETYDGLVTAPDTSAAEELQKLLPYSKVVKAFNTTFAADFSLPVIDGKQVDAFLAGNNKDSLQTMSELIGIAGFNPNNDHKPLINFESLGNNGRLAIPTPEHYLPLLYTLGVKTSNDTVSFFNDKAVAGSLTMTSVKPG